MKNLLSAVTIFIAAIAVAMLVLIVSGYRPFILVSPSMEPLYPKGSLSWIDTKVEPDELQVGDVVVARTKVGNLIMHRLIGENLLQGDANPNPQEMTLDRTNFVGREAFTIPGLGNLADDILANKKSIYIIAAVLFVLAFVLPNKLKRKNES